MENQFSDLPPALYDAVNGFFANTQHPILHAMRYMEFVVCGLTNPGRIFGHPVKFPDFLEQ